MKKYIYLRNDVEINLHSDLLFFSFSALKKPYVALPIAIGNVRFSRLEKEKNSFAKESKFIFTSFLTLLLCCAIAISATAQSITKSFTYDGLEREYIIYLPTGYTPGVQMPLLLGLHGLGDTPSNFQNVGFNSIADAEGFIPVYPAAQGSFLGNAWNSGTPLNPDIDDVGFISALIDSMAVNYNIDADRVYSTGYSMGGIMSYRLACELSDKIAAIASGSGLLAAGVADNCNPVRNMPVLHVHGTDDPTVPYAGSALYNLKSVDETIDHWLTLNNNTAMQDYTMIPDNVNDGISIERFAYGACPDDSEVILYKATGMGHAWLFTPNNDMSQSQAIWDFLKCHSLLPVNTEEVMLGANFQIFPNPASEQLNIQFEQAMSGTLRITDVLGREVLNNISLQETMTQSVNVNQLNKGVYVLVLEAGSNIYSLRFVKQ